MERESEGQRSKQHTVPRLAGRVRHHEGRESAQEVRVQAAAALACRVQRPCDLFLNVLRCVHSRFQHAHALAARFLNSRRQSFVRVRRKELPKVSHIIRWHIPRTSLLELQFVSFHPSSHTMQPAPCSFVLGRSA
jgi:hypothetical protein